MAFITNPTMHSVRCIKFHTSLSKFAIERKFCVNQQTSISKSSEETFDTYTRISKTYEKMANLSSLWFHNHWRNIFVSKLKVSQNMKVIDAAGGQGHTSLAFLKMVQNLKMKSNFHITVCDFCPAMIEAGKASFRKLKHTSNVDWVSGDIHNLPFEDNSFDRYVSSFGIRGVDLDKVLKEAYRVVKPGGQILLMDISNSKNPIVRTVFYRYLLHVVPTISKLLYNEREVFVYLAMSLNDIPDNAKMIEMIVEAGFSDVTCTNIALGMVSYYEGSKALESNYSK